MMRFARCLIAFLPLAALAQGPASQISVVATKISFIWGETVKVKATVRDAQGVERPSDPITWSVIPDTAAIIGSDGSVIPRQLTDFTVRARSGNLQGEVLMQVAPKSIVVTPEGATMAVGSTQKIVASALDVRDQPIAGVSLRWNLSNASGGWNANDPMAEIDSAGRLHSLVAGQLRVTAAVDYPFNPWLLGTFEGATYIQMQPPKTYKFERIFRASPVGATSILGPQPSALLATDNGFDFVASLDGVGSALLEWTSEGITPLLVSGRAHASTGQPLIQFANISRNHNGEILAAENDVRGTFQISTGTAGAVQPLLVPNTPVNGADQTGFFGSSRNSLADSGMKVFSVSYSDAVTHAQANGLFRGRGRGLSEVVVNTIDGLPGFPGIPFRASYYGVADDGTVWFNADIGSPLTTRALFRARYGEAPEKILQEGDALQGFTVTNASPFTTNPHENRFFVASNGDVVAGTDTSRGGAFFRWSAENGWAFPEVLQSFAGGVFWYEPGVGALIDTRSGSANGLYLWNQSTLSPILLLGATSLDGSPVREIFSASANRNGVIYAMVRTDADPMLIARVAPDMQIILKSGDSVPVSSVPLIGAMLRGSGSGIPLVLAGGQTGSIARIADDGISLQPVIRVGEPLPGGKAFLGSTLTYDRWLAQSLPDGRIVFGDANGTYVWDGSTIDWFLKSPVPWAFTVNSQGDLAVNSGNTIYFIHNGSSVRIMGGSDQLAGASVTHESSPIIDDTGRIAFRISTGDGGIYHFVLWDGTTTSIIFSPGQTMPDGRAAKAAGALAGEGGTLVSQVSFTDGQSTFMRYVNNTWELVAGKDERTATGNLIRYSGGATPHANKAGDVVFEFSGAPYTDDIAVKRGNKFYAIHSMGEFTPEGELLIAINQFLLQDDGTLYVLGVNDEGQQVIYRATPL